MAKSSKEVYDSEEKNPVNRSKLDNLEKSGNSSSSTSAGNFYSPGSSSTSTNADGNVDLKSQEASGGFYTPNTSTTGDPKESLFSRAKNFKFTKRNVATGGGILGLAIGVFTFFNFAQGPFQFIHFAQLLQQFHFAGQEDMGDDRVSRLYRYARSGGDIKQTRVGTIGSIMAPRIEAKFARAGITVNYEGPSQIARSFDIDRTHPRWSDMTNEDLRSYAARNNLDMEIEGNRARVIIPTSIFSRSGPVIRWALKESGTYKVVTPIQTRTFGKWAKVTWHPLRQADARVNKTVGDFYRDIKERRDGKIRNGSVPVRATSSGSEDDPNESQEERDRRAAEREQGSAAAREAAALGEAAGEVGNETDGRQGALSSFTDNFKLKLLGAGAVATGALCTMFRMNEMFEALKLAKVIFPLMRQATYAIATGNQVMGGVDAEVEQLGPLSESFNDPEKGSWMNSRTMQAEQGRPQTGPEVDEVLNFIPQQSPFSALNRFSAELGALCSTVGTIIIAAVTIVLSIFTGGGFGVVSLAVNAIGGAIADVAAMRLFAAMFADVAVDSYLRGPAYADYANYGARLSANATGLSRGGAVLSDAESDAIQVAVNKQYNREFSSKSLAYRLFNPYDSKSAFAQLLNKPDPNLSGNIAKISNVFTNFGGYFSSASAAIFAPVRAQTAGGYDYGFPEYGFSIPDLEDPIVENPYTNAEQVAAILEGSNGATYIERAKKCFGINISPTTIEGNEVWSATASLNPEEMPNPYNATDADAYPDSECNDQASDWLQVRFFVFDSVLMDAAYCYEMDDEQSCRNVGFTPPPPPPGGTIDCSADFGDPSTWADQSAGDPPNALVRRLVEEQAPGRSCPNIDYMPSNQTPVPNDPDRQYFAYDGCGDDNCAVQTENGREFIRVKFRDPPLQGNTVQLWLDGGGDGGDGGDNGGSNPGPGPSPEPPPCTGPFCAI